MTELQNRILEELGPTTQSGVEDLSEPMFVQTEINSVKKGLKVHFYFTLFFSVVFTFQFFNSLINRPENGGFISVSLYFLFWAACLYSYHQWFTKRKRLALLHLLLDTYKGKVDAKKWLIKNREPLHGIFWTLTSTKSKYLNEIERKRQTKLFFFITQLVLLVSFTLMALNRSEAMIFGAPVLMLLCVPAFLDWKVQSYFFSLSLFQNYAHEELSVSP